MTWLDNSSSRALRHLTLFAADLGGGGAERMMVQIAAGFAERGVAVDLVLARAVGPYLREVPGSVRIVDLGRRGVGDAILPLASYLRRERPDILFSTLHHASLAAAIALRLADVPTLLFIREANSPVAIGTMRGNLKLRAIGWGMRWAYGFAEGVVAVSEGVAEALVHAGVSADKVKALYNPVVTSEITELATVDPGHAWLRPGAPPVVLGVGSLQPRKGFRTLLDAFSRVRATRDLRLIVLGEGPQRDALQRYAVELGVSQDVDMPGFDPNPFAFMARAAVFVLASEREGLPGVLIQAMACGCPVVATDCPSGPREILEAGRVGTLVPVGDAGSMAEAIADTLMAPRGSAALQASAMRFGRDPIMAAHLELFDHAVRFRSLHVATHA